jgi:GntR family transcriptional regulator, transcriptional repressor for pyruvate dehydrogenase complex
MEEPAIEFPPIRRTAVADDAIATIKEMIVRGEIKAGQRLPAERDLAARLGVSRPSLREAIRALSLEPELLAEPIDFLLQVNTTALIALFEARRALEAGVASLAAERATDLELAQLEDFVMLGRSKVDDPDAFIEHDVEFHARLRHAARSPILASLLSSVNTLSYESRRYTAQSATTRSRALADHQRMIKVLKARDPQAAHLAMVEHLQHVLEGLAGRPGVVS